MHQVGYCRNLLGRIAEAEAILEDALKLKLKTFGNMHPSTAATLHQLACIAQQKGNLDLAYRLLQMT
jgi:hypothetical protein